MEFTNVKTSDLTRGAVERILELGKRAGADEQQDAAESLASVARWAVIELRALAEEKPNLLEPIAQKAPQWPVMDSLHAQDAKANRAHLKKLKLGEKADISACSVSRWSSDHIVSQWALDLIETLRSNQQMFKVFKVLDSGFPKWVKEASKLPQLSKETAKQWGKVGWLALLERYPKPEEIDALQFLAETEIDRSRKRDRIKQAIIRAIKGVAAR